MEFLITQFYSASFHFFLGPNTFLIIPFSVSPHVVASVVINVVIQICLLLKGAASDFTVWRRISLVFFLWCNRHIFHIHAKCTMISELGSMWKEAVVAIPAFAWGDQG